MSVYLVKLDKEFETFLKELLTEFSAEEMWFKKFLMLDRSELVEIASEIEFDLIEKIEEFQNKKAAEHWDVYGGHSVNMEFSGSNIKAILGDEERLKKELGTYQYRESQEKLSLRIGQSFQNGIHAMIQAPTGTGKTLGYLVPSILLAKSKGEQVMISSSFCPIS